LAKNTLKLFFTCAVLCYTEIRQLCRTSGRYSAVEYMSPLPLAMRRWHTAKPPSEWDRQTDRQKYGQRDRLQHCFMLVYLMAGRRIDKTSRVSYVMVCTCTCHRVTLQQPSRHVTISTTDFKHTSPPIHPGQ